jgi:hypothetical protein
MTGKENIEKDFADANQVIERMAEEELKKIKERAGKIKKEAEIIGENVEKSMEQTNTNIARKKD